MRKRKAPAPSNKKDFLLNYSEFNSRKEKVKRRERKQDRKQKKRSSSSCSSGSSANLLSESDDNYSSLRFSSGPSSVSSQKKMP